MATELLDETTRASWLEARRNLAVIRFQKVPDKISDDWDGETPPVAWPEKDSE